MKNSFPRALWNAPVANRCSARLRPGRRWPTGGNIAFHGIRLASGSFVAKKFHAPGLSTRSSAESAALNLRMATMQLMGMRANPRVRTIPMVRRRLPVDFICETPEVISIRHSVQTLDTTIREAQPIRERRSAGMGS
jgi:hypothetical protein